MKDEAKKPERQDMKARARAFALSIIRLYTALPQTTVVQVLGRQLLRAGTSVGAQYHEGCRAKSNADFIHKCEGALQELEEIGYWLALLRDDIVIPAEHILPVAAEAEELIAMFTSMVKSVKHRDSKLIHPSSLIPHP